jgi:hypothetical protein
VTAGLACGLDRRRRLWHIGGDRVLHWLDPLAGGGATPAIPGDGRVLAVDPFSMSVVIADGSALRCTSARRDGPGEWGPAAPAASREVMAMAKSAGKPALIAAGFTDGWTWVCDPERRVSLWHANAGCAPMAEQPVPGDAAVLGCDPGRKTVLLSDGTRFDWIGGQWLPMPGPLAVGSRVKVRVVDGFNSSAGLLLPDTVAELPEPEVREAMRLGRVEVIAS